MKIAYLVERYRDEDDRLSDAVDEFDDLYEFTLKEPDRWKTYKTIVWDYVDED